MNKVPSEALSFMEKAPEMAALASKKGIEIGVAPTFLCLEAVKAKAPKGFVVSAQNVNEHSSGAYTGEVSPLMLRAIGIDHAIIGHSERREYNGETSKACNLKIKALLAEGLTPVYCCGESLATYEAEFDHRVAAADGFGGPFLDEADDLAAGFADVEFCH